MLIHPRTRIKLALTVVIIFSSIALLYAEKPKYTMAFGYVANNTNNTSYNFLEQIFPNNFANTLRFKFDAKVIKPYDLEKIFQKNNKKFKKNYQAIEIPEVTNFLGVDCFISGNFSPLPGNKIRIVLHVYKKKSEYIFTFTTVGKLETEIFNLVDRISIILVDYLSDAGIYHASTVKPGAKIGILTNAKNENLNLLYYPFLEKGYRVASMNGNTIENNMTDSLVQKFWYISTKENKHDLLSDRKKMSFLYGTWMGEKYVKKINAYKQLFLYYDLEYIKTKNDILEKLAKIYTMDYLLIVGFYESSNKAWMRCIRLKDNNLILMQGDISGSSPRDVGDSIVDLMMRRNDIKKK